MLVLAIFFILLIALAWTGSLWLELDWWIPASVSGVLVLIYLGIIVTRRLFAMRRHAAMERELERQAAKQAERIAPGKRPEVLALRKQMNDAMQSLKRSKLGAKSGSTALYTLPWYVMVGPPATGKTTAIAQSGLTLIGGKNAKMKGTAGTRNCEWWFTRDAILLDTAGRYAMDDDDQEEWNTFLDTLRRFRPARPIDGIIVTASIGDFITKPDQIEDLAATLRERLDELISRLELVLPVYVLITKADLIGGFLEFFSDYTKQQRGQAWGTSFALDDERLEEPGGAFEDEFDLLLKSLHARMLQRLANETQPDARKKILQFLVEFRELRAPIARFIEVLCKPNPYDDSPLLRGLYFSSGTQVGNPYDEVLGKMLGSYGLQLAPATTPAPREPRSYFVTDLFNKVIFPDRHLATNSSSRLRREQIWQLAVSGIAVFLMLLVLVPAIISFASNRKLVAATVQKMNLADRYAKSNSSSDGFKAIQLASEQVRLLQDEADDSHVFGFWGSYTAPALLEAAESRYTHHLRQVIEEPVRYWLTGAILQINNQTSFDLGRFRTAHDRLKLLLSLAETSHLGLAKEESAETLDCNEGTLAWVRDALSDSWAQAAKVASKGDRERLRTHACFYLRALSAHPDWAWSLSDDEKAALSAAQTKLSRAKSALDGQCLDWLTEKYKALPHIRASSIFVGASNRYIRAKTDAYVPGVFTAAGWAQVRKELSSAEAVLSYEPWVLALGRGDEEVAVCSSAAVRDLYFEKYVSSWSAFLQNLEVETPQEPQAAVIELQVLAAANGPYERLFDTLRENTQLDMQPIGAEGLLDKAKEKAKALVGDAPEKKRELSPVEQHFTPLLRFGFGEPGQKTQTALSQYLVELTNLKVSLSQLVESGGTPGIEISNAAKTVDGLLVGLDGRNRNLLAPLLKNPITGGIKTSQNSAFGSLNETWKKEVWDYWNNHLRTRYPFDSSPSDASIAEFAEFFRPGGILWGFFGDKLGGMLEGSSRGYGPKTVGFSGRFRADFLNCLTVSRNITEAVFSGEEVNVAFDVKMMPAGPSVAKIVLKVDSQELKYENTPEKWQRLSWPKQDGARLAALEIDGKGVRSEATYPGEFGFFRLLQEAETQPLKGGVGFRGLWRLSSSDAPPVTMEFKPVKAAHPFDKRFFSRLSCPPAIAITRASK